MNGNQKQGIVGLYALGAYDIFSYLNDVFLYLCSLTFNILKLEFHTLKSTVGNYLIFSTKDNN